MKILKKLEKKEKGQSLVELALGFTFILVLLAGAINYGEAFFVWIALREATQEGAVFAAQNPKVSDNAQITNRVVDAVEDEINLFDINYLDVNIIRYDPGNDGTADVCPGNAITIEARYIVRIIVPFVSTAANIVLPSDPIAGDGTPVISVGASTTNTILTSDDPSCD